MYLNQNLYLVTVVSIVSEWLNFKYLLIRIMPIIWANDHDKNQFISLNISIPYYNYIYRLVEYNIFYIHLSILVTQHQVILNTVLLPQVLPNGK